MPDRVLTTAPPMRALEPCAAFGQRQPAHVVVPVAQDIERDERDRLRLVDALDVARPGQMHASLEPLKAGGPPLLVERDDLAVEQQRSSQACARTVSSALDDRGELRRLVVAKPRPEADACRAA